VDQAEENGQVRVPTQQAIDQLTTRLDDLARQEHERIQERPELQLQHTLLLLAVTLLPATRLRRQRQGPPRLEVPGQCRHHHVRPVALQRVHRRLQRPYSALQLRDQILLVAAVVGRKDDLLGGSLALVGDVEEVANLVEQRQLAFFFRDVLAHHHHPVGLVAGRRPVVELGHVFGLQAERLKATLFDDGLLDVAGRRRGCVFTW